MAAWAAWVGLECGEGRQNEQLREVLRAKRAPVRSYGRGG